MLHCYEIIPERLDFAKPWLGGSGTF